MTVYLGLCDEPLQPSATFRDSQLGGYTLWLHPTTIPLCKECWAGSCLVAQLYVPLERSVYERVLYVFSCVKVSCQNKSGAWTVIRQMMRAQEEVKKVVEKKIEKIFEEDGWGTEGDEWEMDGKVSSEASCQEDDICEVMSNLCLKRNEAPGPALSGYYLYVIPEPSPVKQSSAEEDELADEEKGKGGGEKYESTEVSHKDKSFYKFYKKIQLSPEQCIRYNLGGSPLLSDPSFTIPQCEKCRKPRQFEMQIMPPLISILQLKGSATHPLDFRTVLIWTCQGDCVEGGIEVVLCVPEPDINLERLKEGSVGGLAGAPRGG